MRKTATSRAKEAQANRPDPRLAAFVRLTVRQEELEGLVLSALQTRLMDPALLEEFCEEYTRHMNELRGTWNASIASAKTELARLARQRENIIQAIKDGVPAREVKDDLARIAARRDELKRLLSGSEEEPVLLHSSMSAYFREQVAKLAEVLNREENRAEAADAVKRQP